MILHRKPSKIGSVNLPVILSRILALPILILVFLIHRVAFSLDIILFPRLKKVLIKKPLFIVGLPRSGTTTTHRLMASHTELYTSMPLWELLFAPALCQKYVIWGLYRADAAIGGPAIKKINWVQAKLAAKLDDIHPTGLTDPEEDYLGLFPFDGCFLRVLMFPFAKSTWALGVFSSLPKAKRQKLLTSYRGLVQRHLVFRGEHKRLLSKNPSFTTWVSDLAKTFPDADFVGMHRDLEQVVPSQLSSVHSGLQIFGYSAKDPRIVEKFVTLLKLYEEEIKEYTSILGSRMLPLDFKAIAGAPENAVEALYEHFQLPKRNTLDAARFSDLLAETKAYRSKHSYALGEFGLEIQDLRAPVTRPLLNNAKA